MASKSKLEDLNLTNDEVTKITNAFKDEKFREMFCEYAQEISDPENRRLYEEEIAQMERERGMDITFIRPEPGYVLKTSVDGDKKAFINVSKSDKVDKPLSERKKGPDGKNGLMWHIPHSFAPPREDYDKHKNRCIVYDFVIHPDTYRMTETNERFKKVVEDTAMDGIERQFQVKLDRKNLKRPKMQFKGTPAATVIRNRTTTNTANGEIPVPDTSGVLKDMPYPYDNKTTMEKMKERDANLTKKEEKNKGQNKEVKSKNEATTPKYTITHRSEIDMQEYRDAPDAKPSTRPRELVIKIDLPLLKSAAQANLDIFEKRLYLESASPAAYKLDIKLPYPVDDSKGSAKFDKQKRTLVVTLPVVPGEAPKLPSFISDKTTQHVGPDTNGISSELNLGEGMPAEKPLIEVLSNGTDHCVEDGETAQLEETPQVNGQTEIHSVCNGDGDTRFNPTVSHSLPDFTFTQDTETVNFLLKVKNVSENSIRHVSPSNNEIDFVCTSRGDGGFPLHFRLFLRFAESCMIVPEHCTVDPAEDNLVLILLKERGSRGLWDHFWAGVQADKLEKHQFLTSSNLQQQMAALAESCPDMGLPAIPPADQTLPCNLEVTTMNDKKLTVRICPPSHLKTKKSSSSDDNEEEEGKAEAPNEDTVDDDNDTGPPSAEIEVVHSQPAKPNLHGILKQPSDDASHSQDEEEDPLTPTTPTTPSSPGKRRSVSFNKHIDHATFKSKEAVISMKTVLKSKRRRQRKMEEKKTQHARKRHNSTGSEGSLSHSEEEGAGGSSYAAADGSGGDAKPCTLEILDTKVATGDVDGETVTLDVPEHDGSTRADAEVRQQVEDVPTDQQVGPTGSTERGPTEVGSTDKKGPTNTEGDPSNTGSSSKMGASIADKVKSKLAETTATTTTTTTEDSRDDSDDDAEGQDNTNNHEPANQSVGTADGSHNEHRTECAFHFSNNVMFDLDVE